MTDYRYIHRMGNNGNYIIIDKNENILIRDMAKATVILNELNETIQHLQSGNMEMEDYLARLEEKQKRLNKIRNHRAVIEVFKEDVTHSNLQINKLADENEQLKQQLRDKEVEWLRNNTVWEQMPTSKPTVAKTTLSDDFNQSNCITVQKSIISDLKKENEQLKQTMQEVAELLSEEVDLFSDKATEHDICAYVELKELDNKDAYYMAISTKKAIKMLKGDVE